LDAQYVIASVIATTTAKIDSASSLTSAASGSALMT
jgi:hypothetical protein